jgi:uncharacterized protein (DUF1501 family)
MERREFLKLTGLGAAATMLPGTLPFQLFSQDTGTRSRLPTLVVIYLRGGADALNIVVPFADKRYYEIRPTIAIPEKDAEGTPGVIPLDSTFGLHPSLKALKPFWDSKKFAAIVSAGSPHETRSHFDAQDFMEYAAPGMRTIKDGWLNRYLEATKDRAKEKKGGEAPLRAIAMQGLLPRALRGECPVLAVPDKKVLENEKVLGTFKDLYGKDDEMMKRDEDPVVATGKDTLETLERYKAIVEKHRKERTATYPSGRLSQKLQDIAGVIHADAGLEVAALDVGGWDDHTNESTQLSNRLKEYAESVAAFATDLGDLMKDTLILTMTEFGRTCRENGNRGTDHGHGGMMFLVGGNVAGGKVHGRWNGLEDKALYQSRDLPVSTDFRDVFADVLRNHLKFDLPKEYFPKYQAKEIKGLY